MENNMLVHKKDKIQKRLQRTILFWIKNEDIIAIINITKNNCNRELQIYYIFYYLQI